MNEQLKERIAEEWAMLDPVDPLRSLLSDVIDALAQPEQEPLGFMNAGHVHEMQQGRIPYGYVYPKGGVGADIAVYTTPPKRPWVGLTDEEIEVWTPQIHSVLRFIEAKLKEKNNG